MKPSPYLQFKRSIKGAFITFELLLALFAMCVPVYFLFHDTDNWKEIDTSRGEVYGRER